MKSAIRFLLLLFVGVCFWFGTANADCSYLLDVDCGYGNKIDCRTKQENYRACLEAERRSQMQRQYPSAGEKRDKKGTNVYSGGRSSGKTIEQ